ncbi:MAG TPA: SDR family NAD(P)-dependent oxidoreductase [Bdellovibrio sp.]
MKKNKLALITGSTAGIGFAIAEKIATKGFDVIINGRTEERVNKAINQLIEKGIGKNQLHGVAADLSTLEGINKVIELFPEVDVLVTTSGSLNRKTSLVLQTKTGKKCGPQTSCLAQDCHGTISL